MTSFFKRLAQNLTPDTSELESSDDLFDTPHHHNLADNLESINEIDDDVDGELTVDVYDDGDDVFVKTMTAGVRKEDLEITLSRERVTIRGSRYDENSPADEFYVHQELYWGTFSRTIELPEEVDIDHAEASEQHGLLTLRLPKVDKYREAHVSVK